MARHGKFTFRWVQLAHCARKCMCIVQQVYRFRTVMHSVCSVQFSVWFIQFTYSILERLLTRTRCTPLNWILQHMSVMWNSCIKIYKQCTKKVCNYRFMRYIFVDQFVHNVQWENWRIQPGYSLLSYCQTVFRTVRHLDCTVYNCTTRRLAAQWNNWHHALTYVQ